jgi:hypothetical protein
MIYDKDFTFQDAITSPATGRVAGSVGYTDITSGATVVEYNNGDI